MTTRTQYESPDHLTDVVTAMHHVSTDHGTTLRALDDTTDPKLAAIRHQSYQTKIMALLSAVIDVAEFQKSAMAFFEDDQPSWEERVIAKLNRLAGGRVPCDDVDPKAA